MRKILVSTCLLGKATVGRSVRYNAGDVPCDDPRFRRWHDEGRFVHICPEETGGLPTPRPRARVAGERIVTEIGSERHRRIRARRPGGARLGQAPQRAARHPEDFKSKLPGQGRTAALLRSNGIAVFGEDQLDEIERELTAAGELAP
jgi:uncharacterized protein YbbK (DUF523 family)